MAVTVGAASSFVRDVRTALVAFTLTVAVCGVAIPCVASRDIMFPFAIVVGAAGLAMLAAVLILIAQLGAPVEALVNLTDVPIAFIKFAVIVVCASEIELGSASTLMCGLASQHLIDSVFKVLQ